MCLLITDKVKLTRKSQSGHVSCSEDCTSIFIDRGTMLSDSSTTLLSSSYPRLQSVSGLFLLYLEQCSESRHSVTFLESNWGVMADSVPGESSIYRVDH